MRVWFDGVKCSTGLRMNAKDVTYPVAGLQFPATHPDHSGRSRANSHAASNRRY